MPPQKTHPLSWCVEKLPAGATSATHKPADPLNSEATLKLTSLCENSLFLLSHSFLLQNAMDKVHPLSSHTYLSCNQIFSIWRESKCCNCFPKTEKITLRNISNMWLHFNTSWLGNRLGRTEKMLKSLIIAWHNGFALPWGFLAAQLSNRSRKVHHCTFTPGAGPCHTAGFNNKVIVLGGEKKKSDTTEL